MEEKTKRRIGNNARVAGPAAVAALIVWGVYDANNRRRPDFHYNGSYQGYDVQVTRKHSIYSTIIISDQVNGNGPRLIALDRRPIGNLDEITLENVQQGHPFTSWTAQDIEKIRFKVELDAISKNEEER